MLTLSSDLWNYRGLIGNLAQRELKARYKRSVLGWAWSLINPATTLLTYAVVFGTFLKVQPPPAGNDRAQVFALYLFAGLVVWNFWIAVVNGAMSGLIGAGPMLRKVYFPAECPVLASVLVALAQTAVEVSVLLAIMAGFGNFSWTFLFVPIILALLVLFALGVGMVLSLVNVYYRDIQYLVAVGLNVLFYLTPIVYTIALVEDNAPGPVSALVRLNPLTQFVGAMRNAVYDLKAPSPVRLGALLLVSVGSAFVGSAIFRRYSARVSEEL
jgi:ABC-type polysaccharide/polyol phosphate export permease